jgi:uncharacterized protein YydD (DUF2326 family)
MEHKRLVSAEKRFNANFFSMLAWFEDRCEEQYLRKLIRFRSTLEFLDDDDSIVLKFIDVFNEHLGIVEQKKLGEFRDLLQSIVSNYDTQSSKYSKMVESLMNLSDEDLDEFWDFMHSLVRCSINYCYDNDYNLDELEDIVELSKKWDVVLGEEIYEYYLSSEDE